MGAFFEDWILRRTLQKPMQNLNRDRAHVCQSRTERLSQSVCRRDKNASSRRDFWKSSGIKWNWNGPRAAPQQFSRPQLVNSRMDVSMMG